MSQQTSESQRRAFETQIEGTAAEMHRRRRPSANSLVPAPQPPTSALRSRSRQLPAPSPYPFPQTQSDSNARRREASPAMQEAVDRLTQVSSDLNHPLERTRPHLRSPGSSSRAKRRKLNDGLYATDFGPPYGYRGQVVPGPLRMEISFCDGGLHEYASIEYGPENVLRNDLSVYCTKSKQCNMLLRHAGSAPFCLQKLVIKAPETGFTAPIQEGMVFISMDNSEILTRASCYAIRTTPSPSPSSSRSSSPESLPDLVNDRYPALDATSQRPSYQSRPPSRRRTDDGTDRLIPPAISNLTNLAYDRTDPSTHQAQSIRYPASSRNTGPEDHVNDHSSSRPGLEETPVNNSLPVDAHFNVSIDCEIHSDDEEEESSPATLADRRYRDRVPPAYDQTDEFEDLDLGIYTYRTVNGRRLPAPRNHHHERRTVPRRIEIEAPSDCDEPMRWKENAEILKPHAIFFINDDKSMVNIKFDPPV
ncbi:MAG: hypothetical protein LQ352_000353 [Teloschistes flavicans]|nr:MAG: hypothetical protein LQ352_000353 [Teloschistes flavicans]